MVKWLLKELYDENDVLTGYKIRFQVDNSQLPRGEGKHIIVEGENVSKEVAKVIVDEDGNISVGSDTDEVDVKNAYNLMDDEIKLAGAGLFKTFNIVSQLAFAISYVLRIVIPEAYLVLGLKAEKDIGEFTTGDALDTAEKIKSYYSQTSVELDIFRLTKIGTFVAFKKARGK